MKKGIGTLVGLIGFIALLAIILVPSYNGFVNLDEEVNQSYAQIDTQLQRRLDLIPNLVNTVQGYASHEKEVIESVSEARSKLAGASTPEEQATADAELSGALSRLLVVVENYPDLKANQNFQQLMDELAGTENRIGFARKDYNDTVAVYNKKVQRFPGKLIASMFGFEKKEYFKADEAAQKAPEVDFSGANK